VSVPVERLRHEGPIAPPPASVVPPAIPIAASREVAERELLRHYPGLVALLMRRVGDRQLALDLLQDAIVTALTKLDGGGRVDPDTIAGFVFRAAMNHLRNHRRHERVRGPDGQSADGVEADAAVSPAEQSQRQVLRQVVRRVLEDLPAGRDRELIVRFYLDEQDKDDICRSLGLSDAQFSRVIFRARERLRTLAERAGLTRWDVIGLGLWLLLLAPVG
jgi:RNA polymerase sigma-70 factor (ECF subfamily)